METWQRFVALSHPVIQKLTPAFHSFEKHSGHLFVVQTRTCDMYGYLFYLHSNFT
jgi:hypothetical protein